MYIPVPSHYTMPKAPKTTRKELSAYEKGMIIAFFYCFGCITTVSRLVCWPWSTVKSFLVRATERVSVDNLPRSGHPVLLDKPARRHLITAAKKNRTRSRTAFKVATVVS